ncbi:cobalamin biosynthesis protein [Streptomyces sp. NPDC059176]|uniref:cobalamin biosynthesis protein n=1 Tax=unclassified Streptomyces TaxID=2593676 RepID=UPI0036D0DF77
MRELVIGVGARRGVTAEEVLALVRATLREAGAAGRGRGTVVALATVEAKAAEPGIVGAADELGVPLWAYPAHQLARVAVPHPSATVREAVGTPSVAEAAALAGGGELLMTKRTSGTRERPGRATCAIVRRAEPPFPRLPSGPAGSGTGACRTAGASAVPQPPYVRGGSGRAGRDPAEEGRPPVRAVLPHRKENP